jgi:hypothetical protein
MKNINRRGFLGGLFGSVAAGTALSGKVVAGDAFHSDLTTEEQDMMRELAEKHVISIPSRKSFLFTEELRKKRDILKRLVHKNRVCIDYHIARPNDEADETCMVYYLPSKGKTPLDYYA